MLQCFSFTMLVCNDCDSRLMVMLSRKVVKRYVLSLDLSNISLCNCRFIDVPIESCGKASPLRVALQATAPDVLMILLRHGANPCPLDDGSSAVLALMDKLMEHEETGSYPYQLVSCLKILLLAIPFIELPFKVQIRNAISSQQILNSIRFYVLTAIIVPSSKGNVSQEVLGSI